MTWSRSIILCVATFSILGCRGPGEDTSKLKLQIDPQLATTDWPDGPRQEAAIKEIERQSQRFADRLFAPDPMPTQMPPAAAERLSKSLDGFEEGSGGTAVKQPPAWSKGIPEPPRTLAHDLPKPWPVQVLQGETLRTIARWAGTTTGRIIKDNRQSMGRRKWLRAGDRLHITMSANQKVAFDRMRQEHGETRLDNYFATRYIAKVVVYRVSRHESVSDAARRYGDVPLWLLQQFNNRDFTRLRRGAEILIPVIKRYNKADGLPPPLELVDATGEVLSAEKKTSVELRINGDLLGRARLAIDDGNIFERSDSQPYAASRAVLPAYGPLTIPAKALPIPAAAPVALPQVVARAVLVKSGETLGKYAKWGHLSISAIKRANPGLNPDVIQIGSRIRLPLTDQAWGTFVLARAGRRAPVVAPRTLRKLVPLSPLPKPPTIVPWLQAPQAQRVAPVEPLVTVYYTVKPGDIASKIAVRNELNLASLQAMNPSRNLHLLTIGQQLRIR